MSFNNPLLFFICAIGVFNGFLVSFYFLFLSKQKRVQNLFFGLLVLMLSLRIGKSVYIIFTPVEEKDLLIPQLGLSACFLIGVSLFYYLKSSVINSKQVLNSWKIHFSILFLIVLVVGVVKPYESNVYFWHTYFIHFIYIVWGVYLFLSGYVLRYIFKKIASNTQKCTTAELWLVAVFMGNVLIFIAYMIGYFYLYLIGTITFSVVFYGLLFFFLFKKNRETIFQDIPEKYSAKKIDAKEAQFLIEQLNTLMQEKELYKETDIKLQYVAKNIHISTHKLSQLLNDNLGKSFASFINDHRIEEAKRLLATNNQFTLETIGFESGFSSKSNFYATFKKVVGKTPLEFQKEFSEE
ncbi:helix-turn-helix domain-containing protein [uncultured Aquimarina sp.]|uniref:helix-turn-helix domain-containing protein n=1 Tax=uncultured Aquimarina sp. TaxID=575652 RepID=UPI0026169CC1|nr:helix-turn-helix domain-containing protein [uncultured Aquimarina sp.]